MFQRDNGLKEPRLKRAPLQSQGVLRPELAVEVRVLS